MASDAIAYDKKELANIKRAFKAMDDQAITESKEVGSNLANYLKDKIIDSAASRNKAGQVAQRVAQGITVSKSSRIGELSVGFARQRFSGGGTTQQLWPGVEFGSKKFKQFPEWSGRYGGGSRGYFIFPTLRREQAYIVQQWEASFAQIVKRFD